MSKELFQDKYRTKSIRLPWWDYSLWEYFITICTKEFFHYFGKVVDDKMQLNSCGEIVHQEILNTMTMRKNVIIDTFIVMPNHIHMIICMADPRKWICRDALHASQWATRRVALHGINGNNNWRGDGNVLCVDEGNIFGPQKNNLATIIRGLKSAITSKIKKLYPEFSWQWSFYEHIIKSDRSFQNIREYIENNPVNWNEDSKNI